MSVFAHPDWLLSIGLGFAACALVVVLAGARAGRRRRRLLGAGPSFPGIQRDLVLLLALGAIGVALAGPRIGRRSELVTASGVDLVVLLDVSRSMDARDVVPSRLARARRNAELVLAGLEPGDRAALAAFAGRGVLLTPLTPDHGALLELLPSVDGELMRFRSSDLGGGVRAALAAFDPASARPRVLLLLSDGEDPSRGRAERPVEEEAARMGVRILTVALGSESGASVPDHDVPLRDAAGEIVRTRRDLPRLSRLAEATDGRLLGTDDFGAIDPAASVREVRRDAAAAPGELVRREIPAVRAAPFAALAFVLLALDVLGPLPRRLAIRRAQRVAVAGATLFGVVGLAAGVRAADGPEAAAAANLALHEAVVERAPGDAETLLRLGVARARAGLGPEAERAFVASALYARDPTLAALAYFDLGVTALERGEFERARDAFFDALALAPADEEARFNLEWTLHALRENVPPPAQGNAPSENPEPGAGERGDETGGAEGSRERGREQRSEPTGGDRAGEPPTPGDAGADPRAGGGTDDRQPNDASRRETAGAASAAEAPILDATEVERWLRAVQDDPGRALRETARRAGGGERGASREPGW